MKTPEEMAEEYCSTTGWLKDDYVWRETEAGFLAGYKAAKNLYAAKLQEANDTIDGMVDECEGLKTIIYDNEQTNLPTPAKWISVKDRLPEENHEVLISYGQKPFFLIAFLYYPNHPKKDVKMFCGNNNTNYSLDYVTHWQPLSAPPKEEK